MLNSPVDIAIVAGIALLVFGPKKLPELGKAIGQGIGNFRKGLHEAQAEVKNAIAAEEAPPAPKSKDEPETASANKESG